MLEKLTNNVTLCYELGGKFTSPGLIRCVICTGISTLNWLWLSLLLHKDACNLWGSSLMYLYVSVAKEVSVVPSWTLLGKRKYHVYTCCDICTASHVFAKWPSCRRQERARFRPERILPKYRYHFQGDPNHALRKLQWIAWIQNSRMDSRSNNFPNEIQKGPWLHSQRYLIPIFTHRGSIPISRIEVAPQGMCIPWCSWSHHLLSRINCSEKPPNLSRGHAGQGRRVNSTEGRIIYFLQCSLLQHRKFKGHLCSPIACQDCGGSFWVESSYV